MASSVSIELVSSSARVNSVKFHKGRVSEFQILGPIDRTPGVPGSNKKKIMRQTEVNLRKSVESYEKLGKFRKIMSKNGESYEKN